MRRTSYLTPYTRMAVRKKEEVSLDNKALASLAAGEYRWIQLLLSGLTDEG